MPKQGGPLIARPMTLVHLKLVMKFLALDVGCFNLSNKQRAVMSIAGFRSYITSTRGSVERQESPKNPDLGWQLCFKVNILHFIPQICIQLKWNIFYHTEPIRRLGCGYPSLSTPKDALLWDTGSQTWTLKPWNGLGCKPILKSIYLVSSGTGLTQ
jgi:hypothetical protein